MSKLTRKHSKKDIKLTKNKKNVIKTNKKSLNKNININLLVDSSSFKAYQIPQLEKWKKLLNKEQKKQNIKKTYKHKQIKNKTIKRKKITKRKTKKKFLGLF
jgi:hypothetical protein